MGLNVMNKMVGGRVKMGKDYFICKKLPVIICLLWGFLASAQEWQSESGPEGGNVYCMLLKGKYLFAGMESGVYRIDINGGNWSVSGKGISNTITVTCMARLGQTIMAGSINDGTFYSIDDGENWKAVKAGLSPIGVRALTADSSGFYVLTTSNEIFFLSKSDTTWTKVPSYVNQTRTVYRPAAIAVIGKNLLTGVDIDPGIYRSVHNGDIWQPESTLFKDKHCNSLLVDGEYIYAGLSTDIYRSSDSGRTWQEFNNGLSGVSNFGFISSVNNQLYTADFYGEIFRLSKNTSSWISVNKSIPYGFWPSCITGDSNRLFICGNDYGIYTSIDSGATWSPFVSGLCNRSMSDVVVKDDYIFSCSYNYGFGCVFYKTESARSWQEVSSSKIGGNGVLCLSEHKSSIFAGSYERGIYRSDDNGQT